MPNETPITTYSVRIPPSPAQRASDSFGGGGIGGQVQASAGVPGAALVKTTVAMSDVGAMSVVLMVLRQLAEKLLEKLVDSLLNWIFRAAGIGGGDKDSTQQIVAAIDALLEQFCQYVCSFVYETVEQARIKALISEARTCLIEVEQQLEYAPRHPLRLYETLITSGMLARALATHQVAGEQAQQVTVVDYVAIASIEVKLIETLIQLGSNLVDYSTLERKIIHHKLYVQETLPRLLESVRTTHRVGVVLDTKSDCLPPSNTNNPTPTISPDEPNSPEKFDYDNTGCAAKYFQWFHVTVRLERRNWITGDWTVIEDLGQAFDRSQGRPPFNQQIQPFIQTLRAHQKAIIDANLTEVQTNVIDPINDVVTAWDSLLKRVKH